MLIFYFVKLINNILLLFVRPIKVWLAISALKLRAALLCLGLGLTQLIKPF